MNSEIRTPKVRLIGPDGEQVGIVAIREAQRIANDANLDLVEIAPNAAPPVCKVIDYGKFRYDQTKREKENKKAQHQIKVKEVKIKPNIDAHDLEVKVNRARNFLEKGNKVKLTCTFRGREMAHTEVGKRVLSDFCEQLSDIATPEAVPKMLGRNLHAVLAPGVKTKKI